jgi:hypothetical protein
LNDPEALEQTPALQALVTVLLTLKDLNQLQELQARQAEELEWRVARRALRARAGQYRWGIARYPLPRAIPKMSIQVGDSEEY